MSVEIDSSLFPPPGRAIRPAWQRRLLWVVGLSASLGSCFVLGAWLTLLFNVRSPEITTPSAVGLDQSAAETVLRDEGLAPELLGRRHDAVVPVGRVIEQFPPAGSQTKRGRPVRLMVSLGPKRARVPQLDGTSLQRAQMVLGASGLALSATASIPDRRLPLGTVIAQDPPGGGDGDVGQGVRLLVSAGPEIRSYVMPDVVARQVGPVAEALRRLGFARVTADGMEIDPSNVTEIAWQRPPAGYPVKKNQAIELGTQPELAPW